VCPRACLQLNKALLSSYGFKCYFLLLSIQLALSLTFCTLSRDRLGNPFAIPAFDAAVARR
jgi:hypothetical protein